MYYANNQNCSISKIENSLFLEIQIEITRVKILKTLGQC